MVQEDRRVGKARVIPQMVQAHDAQHRLTVRATACRNGKGSVLTADVGVRMPWPWRGVADAPLDVLAQQIVAETSCEDYDEDELFAAVRGAWPYRAESVTPLARVDSST